MKYGRTENEKSHANRRMVQRDKGKHGINTSTKIIL